jgi:RNA 2',3'-cyclic 3'-phosphodiesterase
MPRLFTGLKIPEDIALRLSLLRGGVSGAKWIEPSDYHLTLSFIGNVDDRIASELADELADVDCGDLSVRLTELAAFGGNKPRSIVALAQATPSLLALQLANDRVLRRVGVEPEQRKYTPHVTLARLKGTSAQSLAAFLSERPIQPLEFEVDHFALYSARTSLGGGPYVVEAEYPFGQGSSTESQYR